MKIMKLEMNSNAATAAAAQFMKSYAFENANVCEFLCTVFRFCTFTIQNGQILKLLHFFCTFVKKTCKFLFNIVSCWIHHMIFKFAILSNHTVNASFSFFYPFHSLKRFCKWYYITEKKKSTHGTRLALKMKRKIRPQRRECRKDMWFEQVRCNKSLSFYEIISSFLSRFKSTHLFFSDSQIVRIQINTETCTHVFHANLQFKIENISSLHWASNVLQYLSFFPLFFWFLLK